MKTAAEHKKSAGTIWQAKVSLRSRDSWVNYLSLILLLLIFIEITAFLSCTMFGDPEGISDALPTSRAVTRKTEGTSGTTARQAHEGQARFGAYTAFSEMRGGKEFLILKKGEEETIVDEGTEYNEQQKAAGFSESFADIKFSPQGNYLLYSASDYEMLGSFLYDIKSGKQVMQMVGARVGEGFDITPDEKYLYACVGNGFYEGVPGQVYSLPDSKQVFDAAQQEKGYMDYACSYDAKQNAIVFAMDSPFEESQPQTKEIKYMLGQK